MTWPDRVSVYHRLLSCPSPSSSSIDLSVLILSERHRRPAARLVEDIVFYDYRLGKRAALKPFMVDVLQETWEEQERTRSLCYERASEVEMWVGDLEVGTWKRKGAREDMGGSK
ncbi:hypothetical protein MMC24_002509 [Lignoscripta atroalba]|nr:hypothetical protein [Lignoscripta atroalba]